MRMDWSLGEIVFLSSSIDSSASSNWLILVGDVGIWVSCFKSPVSGFFGLISESEVSGRYSVNVLPSPWVLSTRISPPSKRASSLEIESPSPVPPYCLLVVPSAWWKASNIRSCFSSGIPIPVSETENITAFVPSTPFLCSCVLLYDWPSGRLISRVTPPSLVNLNAFERKFFTICSTLCLSVWIHLGKSSAILTSIYKFFSVVTGLKFRFMAAEKSWRSMSSILISIFPASTLEMSSISLISCRSSEPDEWIDCADSTWSSDRWPSLLSARSFDKRRMLFRGVLSSWDILDRNSDLYLLPSSKFRALSSMIFLASFRSLFFLSTSSFCSSSSSLIWRSSSCCACSLDSDSFKALAFSSSSSLLCRSDSSRAWSSSACCCVCSRRSLVRLLDTTESRAMAMLSATCSRKFRWVS